MPLAHARKGTDTKLRIERERSNRMIDESAAKPEPQTNESVGGVRAAADEKLSEAKRDACEEVSARAALSPRVERAIRKQREVEATFREAPERPEEEKTAQAAGASAAQTLALVEEVTRSERSHAKAAVEQLAAGAEQALEEERTRTDELGETERMGRKHAFFGMLQHERDDTNLALGGERTISDELTDTRDEMLAMISHDLRNLVQAVILKTNLLGYQLSEELPLAKKSLGEIQRSLGVMGRWAADLVDLAELDTGFFTLRRGAHDSVEMLGDAVDIFLAKAETKGITLSVEVPDGRPKVDCDRDRVGQVLANLIDNALKFTSAGGSITVAVDVVGATATFSVADTGPGVLDEDRAHVFEPRWHAHRLRGGGAGLGLHISKRVIDSHGGSIWCENRSPAGVTFFFTLPLAT